MKLTTLQKDRAAGVLLGQAIGDALGVPYEFGPRIKPGQAEMIGGGLGPYAPGEWSDDTQMAICIAEVTASGADIDSSATLDAIGRRFLDWQAHGASDIGVQTSRVLTAARRIERPLHRALPMAAGAPELVGSAGNGALIRNGRRRPGRPG